MGVIKLEPYIKVPCGCLGFIVEMLSTDGGRYIQYSDYNELCNRVEYLLECLAVRMDMRPLKTTHKYGKALITVLESRREEIASEMECASKYVEELIIDR